MRIMFLFIMLIQAFSFAELKGSEIPDFFVLSSNGQDELFKDDLKKSGAKRIVLSFFATYCVSCKEEFALLKKNANELKKQGVQVYLIDVGEDIHSKGKEAANMVKKYADNAFPFYFDPYANSLRNFGLVKGNENAELPLTIILDSDLRVLGILKGKMGKDFPQVLWSEL